MDHKLITSADNAQFKMLKSLTRSKGIQDEGKALVAGKRFIQEVLTRYPKRCEGWINFEHSNIERPKEAKKLPETVLKKALFDDLDLSGTKHPLLLVSAPPLPSFDPDAKWKSGAHIFLPLQQPENMGTVLRSAVAFEASRVVVLKEGAHPFHPKALRSSGVNAFAAHIERGPALSMLSTGDIPAFVLDMEGEELHEVEFPERFALIVGMEGSGTRDLGIDARRIRIPMNSKVESLNAAAAVSICLYAYYTKAKMSKGGST